jgi:hypothetical protein
MKKMLIVLGVVFLIGISALILKNNLDIPSVFDSSTDSGQVVVLGLQLGKSTQAQVIQTLGKEISIELDENTPTEEDIFLVNENTFGKKYIKLHYQKIKFPEFVAEAVLSFSIELDELILIDRQKSNKKINDWFVKNMPNLRLEKVQIFPKKSMNINKLSTNLGFGKKEKGGIIHYPKKGLKVYFKAAKQVFDYQNEYLF